MLGRTRVLIVLVDVVRPAPVPHPSAKEDEEQMMQDCTVRLTDKSEQALQDMAALTELSRTDVINRALQVYQVVAEHLAKGADVRFAYPDGSFVLIRNADLASGTD
jgi:hypothetical protein